MPAVTASITAENNFTDKIQIVGHFNLSISGTWAATVTVQRSWNGTDWFDVDTFTSNYEGVGFDAEEVYYRAGVKTGAFTSGTVVLRMSDNRNFGAKDVFIQ
jgi:hypothetical protein